MQYRNDIERLKDSVRDTFSPDFFSRAGFLSELRSLESRKKSQIYDRVRQMRAEAEKRIVEWRSGDILLFSSGLVTHPIVRIQCP